MKFALCNEIFQDWPMAKGLALAAECGYTGIEVAPFTIARRLADISEAKRRGFRDQAAAAGLEIVGLHWLLAHTDGLYLTTPDAAVRRKTADYLGRLADLCADLGGRVLVLGSPQQRNLLPGVTAEAAARYLIDVLTQALPALEAAGVLLALEPLGPEWTDFLRTADEAVAVIEAIGSPYVRLHLDAKALASESEPGPQVIRRHGAMLAHFHANDPNSRGPGFGDLDFGPVLEALGAIDFRGWVSVEVFDFSPGIERLVGESIRYLQECLVSLARQARPPREEAG